MSSLLLSLALLVAAPLIIFRRIGARDKDLPPGPPTLPIIGNLHIFPKESTHLRFTEWARKYGGIFSLKLGAGTVIVITCPEIAHQLLEKRSATTADRPSLYVADLVTGGLNMGLIRYGDTWRAMRRAAHSILTPKATARHFPIQIAEATQLLYDMLCTAESFNTHIKRYSSSVIMSVLHGKRSPRYETPDTADFFRVEHEWSTFVEPGATPPVDLIPILKYVPAPLAKWKRTAARIREMQRGLYLRLLAGTEERVQRGEHNGSYMEVVLERRQELGLDRHTAAYLGGSLVEAGSETTSSFLNSLILCLVAYPQAQKHAQEEIDGVVGQDRLPTLEDLQNLPYIRAIILETHRFRPVTPLLLPHATTAPETYKNYSIPAGSTIFVNYCGISHDPMLYDGPEVFCPNRYLLADNGTKPGLDKSSMGPTLAFGFGRRSCPGIHLAENSININAMNLIWAFKFEPALDKDGNVIEPDTFAYSKGITCEPLPFKCRITPRTAEKAEIIRREFWGAADTFKKFEFGLSEEDKEFVLSSRDRF
ncbi:cytochrome P450 [Roridomyces roridus]|uniref:Cytochrome P450 n=1 Tax=Roridomyces roridus TaxID=1738132 RepID=A0AAD7BE89_9AGAR|nr:cytochrome P450 [Roridomyces roridus]